MSQRALETQVIYHTSLRNLAESLLGSLRVRELSPTGPYCVFKFRVSPWMKGVCANHVIASYFKKEKGNLFIYHTYCIQFKLSHNRPPLGHDKVIAYGRWSLKGKINKISLILD